MAAPPTVHHKVGDTFRAPGVYRDANGNTVDLRVAGITIASAVRSAAGGLHDLDIEILDQDDHPGGFELRAETGDWPTGPLQWDVQFTSEAGIGSSQTFRIVMLPDVTP